MGSRTDVASRDWVSRRTSCRIIVIICDRAVVCCRRRSLCSLFFYCSCVVPTPGIPPRFSSRSIGLWVFLVFILESRADVASRGWISRAAGLSSCVLARLVVVGAESRCTLLCDRSCAVPAPVTHPPPTPSSSRSVGLWVFRVWGLGRMSRRGTGFRRTSYRIVVFICDRAVVCCRCRSLCSLFCGCSCAVPAPVIPPHS